MGKNKTHIEFIEELTEKNEAFRNGEFVVVGEYVAANTMIIVKTKYGDCKVSPSNLLNGTRPTILSATDKKTFIIEKFREVHGDTYMYDRLIYKGGNSKVEIYCETHKEYFWQFVNNHLKGSGCPKCGTIRGNLRSTKQNSKFLQELTLKNKHFREGVFSIESEYVSATDKILIRNKYGLCSILPNALLSSSAPSITAAINKTEYFKNQLLEKSEPYREGKYELVGEYVDITTKIVVKDKYGESSLRPDVLTIGGQPSLNSAVDKTAYFINMLLDKNQCFRRGDLTLKSEYVSSTETLLLLDKYGEVRMLPSNLLRGGCPNIYSAVDKNSYFVNMLLEKNKDFKAGLFTLESNYVGALTQLLVSNKFGLCKMLSSNLLNGASPNSQSAINKTDYFINEAIEKHGDTYKYDKVDYKGCFNKVEIYCKVHKEYFSQTPASHTQGAGCNKCGNITIGEHMKEKTSGWSYGRWEKAGRNSKDFDSYKVYIIKCWNDEETFYKIGRTFVTLKRRFGNTPNILLPYNFKVLKLFTHKTDGVKMGEIEKQIQKDNKEHKYLPKIHFNGKYECFSKINEETLDFEIN